MATVTTEHGPLDYQVLDLTPPWLTAPPTILFHHGVAINRGIWSGWLPVLADHYRLVTYDVRGYGRSHIPEEGFPWSMEGLAADVLAVADAVGEGNQELEERQRAMAKDGDGSEQSLADSLLPKAEPEAPSATETAPNDTPAGADASPTGSEPTAAVCRVPHAAFGLADVVRRVALVAPARRCERVVPLVPAVPAAR